MDLPHVNGQWNNVWSVFSQCTWGYYEKASRFLPKVKNRIISDIADNVENYNPGILSQSYWIDKTAPTANAVSASTTVWTNADVTLSVTGAADALSGFDKIVLPNASTTTSTSASQVVSANGNYTFAIRDIAGNINNKTIAVGNIDKVAPTANNCNSKYDGMDEQQCSLDDNRRSRCIEWIRQNCLARWHIDNKLICHLFRSNKWNIHVQGI